jgi:predicted ATPase
MGLNAQQFGQQQGLSNQAAQQRQAMLNEAYTAQSRPLDLINSLRTGSQVQNPQFSSYAQQATTQGADLLGAANSLYGSRLDAANAQNARTDAMIQGLFSAGGSMAGGK